MDRNALDHRPLEAGCFNFGFTFEDFIERPGFAAIDVMQRRDNTSRTSLFDILQRDRVLWPEPTPGFFHSILTNFLCWLGNALNSPQQKSIAGNAKQQNDGGSDESRGEFMRDGCNIACDHRRRYG